MSVDYTKLRTLAEDATPGPWKADGWQREAYNGNYFVRGDGVTTEQVADCGDGSTRWEENASYIAAASPDVVLALLDEIERLRERADAINAIRNEQLAAANADRERLLAKLESSLDTSERLDRDLTAMRAARDALAKAHPVMLTLLAWIADEASVDDLRDMAIRYSDEHDALTVWLDEHSRVMDALRAVGKEGK